MSKDLGQQMIESYCNKPDHDPETLAELIKIAEEFERHKPYGLCICKHHSDAHRIQPPYPCAIKECRCAKFIYASDSPSESTVERTVDLANRKPTIRTEIEAIAKDIEDWHGFREEAMANLPEQTRKFVDDASWAGEELKAERLRLAVDAIMSKLETIIPEENRNVDDYRYNQEIRNYALGFNAAIAEMRLRAGLDG